MTKTHKEFAIFINGERSWKDKHFLTMRDALRFTANAFISSHVSAKHIEIKKIRAKGECCKGDL